MFEALRDIRRAHGCEMSLDQTLGVRSMPRTVAKPNGVVQPFAAEVHAVVVREDPDVDVWMARAEAPEARKRPARRERSDYTDGKALTHAAILEPIQDLT